MGWAVGWDGKWQRDVGYGVPTVCDWPDCAEKVDRGLSYVCGGDPFGGEDGCGLYFCMQHGGGQSECDHGDQIPKKPDTAEWMQHKLTHPSWRGWRDDYPDEVAELRQAMADA